jgi:hypothetical protein
MVYVNNKSLHTNVVTHTQIIQPRTFVVAPVNNTPNIGFMNLGSLKKSSSCKSCRGG